MTSEQILQILISLIVGAAITIGFYKLIEKKRRAQLEEEAERFLESARRKADTERSEMLVTAKEAALSAKAESDEELVAGRKSQLQREQKLDRRDEQIFGGDLSLRGGRKERERERERGFSV